MRSELPRGDRSEPALTRPPTIYDVAAAAGVSASTVSRAFSRPGRTSAAMGEHVRRVAAELGYRVTTLGPALATGRTRMLALVVSDVTNPYYTEIIRGAQSAASDAGYTLVLIDAQESEALEYSGLERTLPVVEGVVLAGTRLSDEAIAATARKRPVVVLNREVAGVPAIVLDNEQGMRAALAHLTELGHTSVTYIAGPEASSVDEVRWHSMRKAAHDLGCRAQWSGPWAPTTEGGREAAAALTSTPTTPLPSAVVAFNDQVAIGLIIGLRGRGVRIPQDISVVGFDNIFPAQLVSPPLTTVAAPLRAQGRAAVNAVVTAPEPPVAATRRIVTLPVKLIARDSSGPRCRTGT